SVRQDNRRNCSCIEPDADYHRRRYSRRPGLCGRILSFQTIAEIPPEAPRVSYRYQFVCAKLTAVARSNNLVSLTKALWEACHDQLVSAGDCQNPDCDVARH